MRTSLAALGGPECRGDPLGGVLRRLAADQPADPRHVPSGIQAANFASRHEEHHDQPTSRTEHGQMIVLIDQDAQAPCSMIWGNRT